MSSLIGPEESSTESDIIFRDGIEEDDELWAEYLQFAKKFDTRLVDDWTKIVDTILVYIALFIAILTAFIINASQEFQPDPNDITNQLLVAIYSRMTNASAPIVDTNKLFTLDHTQRSNAVFANALLYTSLGISIIISVLASTAKLWLLRYSRTVAAPGPPFERAMDRQEAYSGLVAWKMEGIIESLPVLVTIAVILFGIFIHFSIAKENPNLGYFVGTLLSLGLTFLLLTSMSASYIPTSPFQSAFSDLIRYIFNIVPNYAITVGEAERKAQLDTSPTIFRTICIFLVCSAVACITAFLCQRSRSAVFQTLICFSVAGVFALMKRPEKKDKMKPRVYGIPEWAIFSTCTIATTLVISAYLTAHRIPYIISFAVACILIFAHGYQGIQLSRFAPDITSAEAVAWMLQKASSQHALWFRKAGEIGTSEVKRALLFQNLFPLLSPLITSIPRHVQEPHTSLNKDQMVYVMCLARLTKFTPSSKSFWKNEAAFPQPVFSSGLCRVLLALRDCPHCSPQVKIAAKEALTSSGYGDEKDTV